MKSEEIRSLFFSFFESNSHKQLSSSSLIPQSDPTLLFTNAGMVQFKAQFTGEEKAREKRVVTIQKCVRAGGKHNDLENVGVTKRHHTFFEMLGNFSFGDYFKEEAIELAWKFITETLEIDIEKLWVTVFEEDDEAFDLWEKVETLKDGRVLRMGMKDNFWQMGDIGPCGPCSEIFYDQGSDIGCNSPTCAVGCDCDRYLEIWNLVFMQFERDADGNMTSLPKPSIDTGMGLERVAAVTQSVFSNYESDLFVPLIKGISDHFILEAGSPEYGQDVQTDIAVRVVADHVRAISFMISDGIMPSNEGRGYVLRRIIRRAARHGNRLGLKKPFLYKLLGLVIDRMKDTYPELEENRSNLMRITKAEEERFLEAMKGGLGQLSDVIGKLDGNSNVIPGFEVFKMHDTFGLPVDMIEDFASASGYKLDLAGYKSEMEQQRTRSRESAEKDGALADKTLESFEKTNFKGYDASQANATLVGIKNFDGEWVESAESTGNDEYVELILDVTPFYGESGGQVGDSGVISSASGGLDVEVESTSKVNSVVIHRSRILSGRLNVGDEYIAAINVERRDSIKRNHTATHILHHVLRKVLGSHVRQAGSLVTEARLRFDFTHFNAVTKDELNDIEKKVNALVISNESVSVLEMEKDEAVSTGAMAFFDDKYDEKVRVVSVGGFSKELCGGTHANSAGDIGMVKFLSESGVAAGVRRIEAVTGMAAFDEVKKMEDQLQEIALLLKTPVNSSIIRVGRLITELKQKDRELSALKDKLDNQGIPQMISEATNVDGVMVISKNVGEVDVKGLRGLADKIREKFSSGVIHLGSITNGKAMLFCAVSKDLTEQGLHAGNIVKQTAAAVNGGGGGNALTAQAGGSDTGSLDKAIEKIYEVIKGK